MKRNIFWLAGCLMVLGACDESEYELQNLVPEEYHKILYVNHSGKQEMTLFDTDEDYTYTLSVIKAGSDPLQTASVNVGVMTQEQLDNEYSHPEAVNYRLLTEDSYSLTATTLDFTAEEHSKSVEILVNSTKVKALMENDPSAEWVLPLVVTSEKDSVNSEMNRLFLQITDVLVPSVGFVIPDELTVDEYQFGSFSDVVSKEIQLRLDTENRWEIACTLEADENYVTAYNEAHGTVFRMLPEGSYSFAETTMLAVGNTTLPLSVSVDGAMISSPGDYMLPVRIASVSMFEISETGGVYPVMIRVVGKELDRTGWTATANSEETTGEGANGGPAQLALDGNLGTYWHSIWQNGSGVRALPYEIVIDTKSVHAFTQFGMIQRGNGFTDTGSGEFYVSMDGVEWGTPVGTFTMQQNTEKQIFSVMATQGRYVKIKVLSSYRDNNCSFSEIYAYGN